MTEAMTIDQVREERRLLAQQIQQQVKAFNDKTGLSVEYVNLNYADLNAIGEKSQQVLISVEIELNI